MREPEVKYGYFDGEIKKFTVVKRSGFPGYISYPYDNGPMFYDNELFDSAAVCYYQNLAEKETELETIQREILELKQALIDFKE